MSEATITTPYTHDDVPKGYPGISAFENGYNECLRRMLPLVEECRAALAEELAAWDLDPPLAPVKRAHDLCVAQLAAVESEESA